MTSWAYGKVIILWLIAFAGTSLLYEETLVISIELLISF